MISSSYRRHKETQNGGGGRGERKDAREETFDLINLHRLILSDSLPPAIPMFCIFQHSTQQQQQQQLMTTHSNMSLRRTSPHRHPELGIKT